MSSPNLIESLPVYPARSFAIPDWVKIKGPGEFRIHLPSPVLTPYYNLWGRDVYQREGAFDDFPAELPALSTSGSVVVLGLRGFAGVSGRGSCRIRHDGKNTLTINLGADQTLFKTENGKGYEGWRHYNEAVGLSAEPEKNLPHFFFEPEYNTWVEQVRRSPSREAQGDMVSDELVSAILDELDAEGMPRGKFVIDFGWHTGRGASMSDWNPDRRRFPDLKKTAENIHRRGFTPGLWLAPAQIGTQSEIGKKIPGSLKPWTAPSSDTFWADTLALPGQEVRAFYLETFSRAIDWGFRKFKLDLFYGPRQQMIDVLSMVSEVIHEIDPRVEVESHIPDASVSEACQVVRTNDVNVNDKMDWRKVTLAHFRICEWSSPHRVINYDFIGGNDPKLSEESFIAHGNLFLKRRAPGYACVGLLPRDFRSETKSWFQKTIGDFHGRS